MGSLSQLHSFNPDQIYSDAELRIIACEYYCTHAGGNHLPRIARKVGKPVAVIQQWHQEDKWTLKRATILAQKHEDKLAQLTATLQAAGVKDAKADAIDSLKLLQDAKEIAKRYVKTLLHGNETFSPVHPERSHYLRQVLACLEQIDKLSAAAYEKL